MDQLQETHETKRCLQEKLRTEYLEAISRSEEYRKKSGTKVRFSDEMKPGRNDFWNATYQKTGSFESSIFLSFRKGKYYTEENILEVLETIYRDFEITRTPLLEDLTVNYTVTRVWEDRVVPGMKSKQRIFYIRLS